MPSQIERHTFTRDAEHPEMRDDESVTIRPIYYRAGVTMYCDVAVATGGMLLILTFKWMPKTDRAVRVDDNGTIRPRLFEVVKTEVTNAFRERL